eukprot:Nk52_evm1s239 gene=Nk52_evmTU1s239
MDIRNFFAKSAKENPKSASEGSCSSKPPSAEKENKCLSNAKEKEQNKRKSPRQKKSVKKLDPSPIKKVKKRKVIVEVPDMSDVEEYDPVKAKKSRSRKAAVIDSEDDSDFDISEPAKSKTETKKKTLKSPAPKKVKVDPKGFFGNVEIKRNMGSREAKVVVEKAKKPEPKAMTNLSTVMNGDSISMDSSAMDSIMMDIDLEEIERKALDKTKKSTPEKAKAKDIEVEAVVEKKSIPKVIESPKKLEKTEKNTHKEESMKEKSKESSPKKECGPEATSTASLAKKGFNSYLNREGPQLLGSRPPPEGKPNCLEGLSFVITGELETITREDAQNVIRKYGGKVASSVSSRTSYVVLGRDPGPKKLELIEKHKTKTLDEDGFYSFISSQDEKVSAFELKKDDVAKPAPVVAASTTKTKSDSSKGKEPLLPRPTQPPGEGSSILFVDKYKPKSVKDLIGNNAVIQRLIKWLKSWEDINLRGKKTGFSTKQYRKGSDDGHEFKAALLSGSPGIGKTSAALLVCKELGYEPIEFNASDTRSKKSLEACITELMGSHSVREYFMKVGEGKSSLKKKCLIMDEIDGMSSGDRGGLAELTQLIKKTKTPVICMCNDTSNPKMRTIVGYCFDLRFQRPQPKPIMGKMMSIAFKEGIKITPPAMEQIILTANCDVRQTLNALYMWKLSADVSGNPKESLSFDNIHSKMKDLQKNAKFSCFDVAKKLLSGADLQGMSFGDKMGLYFHDPDIVPLMMQENYLLCRPHDLNRNTTERRQMCETLQRLSNVADDLSMSDLINQSIRGGGNWSLMPSHAVFTCMSAYVNVRGSVNGRLSFPSWLGQNSKSLKYWRLLKEVQIHMRIHSSGTRDEICRHYLPVIKDRLIKPLKSGNAEETVDFMEKYFLNREDFDIIMELASFGTNPMSKVEAKQKAAFTRTFNKADIALPYSTDSLTSKKKKGSSTAEKAVNPDDEAEVEETSNDSENDEEVELDLGSDIKAKKTSGKSTSKAGKSSTKAKGPSKATKSKGKGKAVSGSPSISSFFSRK